MPVALSASLPGTVDGVDIILVFRKRILLNRERCFRVKSCTTSRLGGAERKIHPLFSCRTLQTVVLAQLILRKWEKLSFSIASLA